MCFCTQKKDLFAEIPHLTFSLSDFSLFFILLFWGYQWEVGMQLSISPFPLDQRFRPFLCHTKWKLSFNLLQIGSLCFEDQAFVFWGSDVAEIVNRQSQNSMSILSLLSNWILNLFGKAMLIARKVSFPSLSGSWMCPSNPMLVNEVKVEGWITPLKGPY